MKEITIEELKNLIGNFNLSKWEPINEKPIFIDFYADWCGPCKMVAPILEELSDEYKDIEFFKINIETEEYASKYFNIKSIPTFMLFKKDEETKTLIGAVPKEKFINFLKEDNAKTENND